MWGDGGGRGDQESDHMYIHGWFMSMYVKTTKKIIFFFLKFLKIWEYKPLYLPPEKPVWSNKKQHLEPYMEKWTGLKLGKEYVKAVYCHPAYLTYIQRTLCEILDWMNHTLESRHLGEISTISDIQMTPL